MSDKIETLQEFCRGALNDPGWSNAHWFGFLAACLGAYAFVGGICQKLSGTTIDREPFGLVWPFVLPFQLGGRLVDYITRNRIPRAEVSK